MNAAEKESKKPSEETEDYWIFADNETNNNNTRPEHNCGKWLVFESVENIDEAWNTVKNATENGQLGFSSKVSTMKDKEERSGGGHSVSQSVICVYTSDWTDEKDVFRVREELKHLGFTKKLPYKTDQDTIAGNYSGSGKRVSKYYS